jgi:RimJ/RimL family protein N-acetyltransferase
MFLETPRLLLRPFQESDVKRWAQMLFADTQVMRYFPASSLKPRERARRRLKAYTEHWQEQGFGIWAITLKPKGDLIGQCGLNKLPETGEIEVDYMLAKAYWKRGYATEAAQASLWFGFEKKHLERIIGLVVPENTASRLVLEKIGMVFVKEAYYFGLDVVYYAIQQQDYRRLQPLDGLPPAVVVP